MIDPQPKPVLGFKIHPNFLMKMTGSNQIDSKHTQPVLNPNQSSFILLTSELPGLKLHGHLKHQFSPIKILDKFSILVKHKNI